MRHSVRLRHIFARRDESDRPDLPLLSVYRDLGVVLREGRDDNFNKPGENLSAYRVVHRGDVVLNKMKTWQGSIAISDHVGIVSPAYFVGRPLTHDEPRFLHHLLRSRPLIAEYGARSKGIRPSQWDLPWDEFGDIRVELPPLDEQRAIANYLDRETARIDALIAAKEQMVELAEEALASFIEEGLAPYRRLPLRRLLLEQPQYGAAEAGDDPRDGWPRYVRITDLDAEGCLRPDGARSLDPSRARPFMLTDGDTLFARSGATVGKAFLYRASYGPACFAGYLIRFRFDPGKISFELVDYWTRTHDYWRQVELAALQATIENVSADKYKELAIPVPPRKDQSRLIGAFAARSMQTRRLQRTLASQVELLRERRRSLTTAAVTGDLSVRVTV